MDEAVHLSLEDYINHMIDAFDHFVAANPGYRAVFVQSRLISTEIVAMDTAFNQEIIQQLADFFAVRNPLLEPGPKFNCYSGVGGKCA